MIGGYLFHKENADVMNRLNSALGNSYKRVSIDNSGFLFYNNPFSDFPTMLFTSENLTLLSQDLLVSGNSNGDYSTVDLRKTLPDMFKRRKTEVFNDIVTDYRLVVIDRQSKNVDLYLVSNRAGNGRMYYARTESGIVFSSDARFLLKIIPFQANDMGIYALLKYGAVPEPMTISENISAVPAAHYVHFDMRDEKIGTFPYFQFAFPCEKEKVTDDFDVLLRPVRERLVKSAHFLGKHKPAILISGGIDSSLYASYLHEVSDDRFHGINCIFGDDDPEFEYAKAIADKVKAYFHFGRMAKKDALDILNDSVTLTGHPFSDFSSLPIVFILKFMKEHVKKAHMLIEGNGGDDCFGFPDLTTQSKILFKSRFPGKLKETIAFLFKNSTSWKWESQNKHVARLLALADVHEINPLNYFLALVPDNFLGLNRYRTWNRQVTQVMDRVFSSVSRVEDALSYEANTTIRQLMHVNSRRWAAKAYSVGESLGIRIIYPYIWRDILVQQGSIPWQAKVNNGIIKWPLKRLLEEYMPGDFIYRQKSGFVPPFKQWLTSKDFNGVVHDVLLSQASHITRIVPSRIIEDLLGDALSGKNLRHAILNFLWGALFTEMWIQKHGAM